MRINQSQWFGVSSLLILVVSIQFSLSTFPKQKNKPLAISSENNIVKIDKPFVNKVYALRSFDPNELTQKEWQELGFSERQANTILKYKNRLGGQFSSSNQIKKCYVINEQKFNELLPFIKITETSPKWDKTPISDKQVKPKIKSFNPNLLDIKGWQNLGFSEKQANSILRYKNSLGGRFTSKNQIKKCFVISETKYIDLESFLIIKEETTIPKIEEKSNFPVQENPKYIAFDPNQLEQNEWQDLGFSEKQAITILKYKKSLGGKFTSKEQIKKCYVISEHKFEELEPYLLIQ